MAYYYQSQLPHMFDCIAPNSQNGDIRVLKQKQQLWRIVLDCKAQVLSDPEFKTAPDAVKQYQLELWAYEMFFGIGAAFPGVYPTIKHPAYIHNPNPNPTPAYSPSFTEEFSVPIANPNTHPAFSPSTQGLPIPTQPSSTPQPAKPLPPPDVPLTERVVDEIRSILLQIKGPFYVPQHDWDPRTGLPRYSILCTARNGFRAFCGHNQDYFRILQKREGFNKFRIMYQKLKPGFMILWLEAKTWEQTLGFHHEGEKWEEFKRCWGVLKRWAVEGNRKGEAMNLVGYLAGLGKGGREWDTSELELPPFPKQGLPQW